MICISLAGQKPCDILEVLKSVAMAEIRLDLLDITAAEIEKIFQAHSNLIATCRPEKLSEETRWNRLSTAITSGAAYVDIELESTAGFKLQVKELARINGTKVIISSHNFIETPSDAELAILIRAMQAEGADLVKLACKTNSKRDASRILSLYANFKNIIAIGMGNLGIVTRVAAPFLGAPFTFAANKMESTAPGQIPYDQLQRIFQIMNQGEQ